MLCSLAGSSTAGTIATTAADAAAIDNATAIDADALMLMLRLMMMLLLNQM